MKGGEPRCHCCQLGVSLQSPGNWLGQCYRIQTSRKLQQGHIATAWRPSLALRKAGDRKIEAALQSPQPVDRLELAVHSVTGSGYALQVTFAVIAFALAPGLRRPRSPPVACIGAATLQASPVL